MVGLDSFAADLEGDYKDHPDVESYTQMRLNTNEGGMSNLCVTFLQQPLPTEVIREHPEIKQIRVAAWKWSTYVNDLFSYSKEEDEPRTHNVIKVLMASEGLSLPQAGAWRTVNITNAIAEEIMELETRLPTSEDEAWNEVVRAYVRVKEAMSGKLYWYSVQKRYRHAKAPFPKPYS